MGQASAVKSGAVELWTVTRYPQIAVPAGQGWYPSARPARVERTFETFEGKLAQLTGPLLTWAAQDLSVAPVADLPTDIEVLLRARNLVDGELLRRLQV